MTTIFQDIEYLTEDQYLKKWSVEKINVEQINQLYSLLFPLTRCVYNKWYKAVMFLLKNGADINKPDDYGGTALSQSVYDNNMLMVKLLSDNGADVKINNWLALRVALFNDDIRIIKYIINYNDIDTLINESFFGLHQKKLQIIRILYMEQIRTVTMLFFDLPQYIILWITDWLSHSDCLREYEKVGFIEAVQQSVRKVLTNR